MDSLQNEIPEFIQGLATKKSESKQRREILEKATAKEGTIIYSAVKSTGKQKKLGYVNVVTLYYDFVDVEKPYMNFTVQLLLGIRNNGRHLQYAIK